MTELLINLLIWIILISFWGGILLSVVLAIKAINKHFQKVSQSKSREAHKTIYKQRKKEANSGIYIAAIILLIIIAVLTQKSIFLIIAIVISIIRKTSRTTGNSTKKQNKSTNNTNLQWEKVILPDGTEFYKLKRSGDFDIEQQKRINELIAMQKLPYSKKNLLTPTEYRFWIELKAVCDAKCFLICPKVRMEDFIQVNLSSYTEKQRYRSRIKSRHIDFMLCDDKLKILAGIELDDKSHNKEEAQKNDEFKNQVFFNLGLPLYRVKVKSEKYAAEIEQIINDIEKFKKTTDQSVNTNP